MQIKNELRDIESNILFSMHEYTKLYEEIPWIIHDYRANNYVKEYKFSEEVVIEKRTNSNNSLYETIKNRRTKRNLGGEISFIELSELIYNSLINTEDNSFRPYPSAGARYPIDFYLVVFDVKGLENGVYYVNSDKNILSKLKKGNYRKKYYEYCLKQNLVNNSNFLIVFTSSFNITTDKYGVRGYRYVFLDCGHAAQNLCLVSEHMKMSSVPIGGFYDDKVRENIGLNKEEKPIYIMVFGREKND